MLHDIFSKYNKFLNSFVLVHLIHYLKTFFCLYMLIFTQSNCFKTFREKNIYIYPSHVSMFKNVITRQHNPNKNILKMVSSLFEIMSTNYCI